MIFNIIIIGLMQLLAMFFNLFNFIAFPLNITNGLDTAIDFMMIPFGVVVNYVGQDFLFAVFVMIFTIFPALYSWLILKWIMERLGVLK